MVEVVCYLCSLLHPLAITDCFLENHHLAHGKQGFEERNTVGLKKGLEDIIHV